MNEGFGSAFPNSGELSPLPNGLKTFVSALRLGSDSGDEIQKPKNHPRVSKMGGAQRTFRHCFLRCLRPESRTEALCPRAR